MSTAILSDIHGNLEAFDAIRCVVESRRVERWIFLGDAVGYGADPAACLEQQRALGELALLGNHDAAVAGRLDVTYFNQFARRAVAWTKSELVAPDLDYLRRLPLSRERDECLYVHAEPSDPGSWGYVDDAATAAAALRATTARLCFVGHSHRAFACRLDDGEAARMVAVGEGSVRMEAGCRYLVNAGSVGQPRDGDPRACCVLFDDGGDLFEFLRIEYDIAAAQAKIEAAGLPRFLAERLQRGR